MSYNKSIEKDLKLKNVLNEFSIKFKLENRPKGPNIFGYWVQTLSDLHLLDLELKGLIDDYEINPISRIVRIGNVNHEMIRKRIAHLETIDGISTIYNDWIEKFADLNGYAYHNIYPYKGKYYPRLVRSLINAFNLNSNHLLLDPFNGSGTTTHEASLMGIKSYGCDISPVANLISFVKNYLINISIDRLNYSKSDLQYIFNALINKTISKQPTPIEKVFELLYFDTLDAIDRCQYYKNKNKFDLFNTKLEKLKESHQKIREIQNKNSLMFENAEILQYNIIDFMNETNYFEKFDACITSPPYYFSLDYLERNKIAFNYWNIDINKFTKLSLGMDIKENFRDFSISGLPYSVYNYLVELKKAYENIYKLLKPKGKFALVIGDSTLNGNEIPTTMISQKFCKEIGFSFIDSVFNPLLGVKNNSIRGETILLYEK